MAKRSRDIENGDDRPSKRTRAQVQLAMPSFPEVPMVPPVPSIMVIDDPPNEVEDNEVERRLMALQRTPLPNSPVLPSILRYASSPDHILFANRPLVYANLFFPEGICPSELYQRQVLANRIVTTQRSYPPALPRTRVPELEEKELIGEKGHHGAGLAAEITKCNRERNNAAAMRGRKVKDEKIANGEIMRIEAFARTTWLEMKLATLGVDADMEWQAVPDAFKDALRQEIMAGVEAIYEERLLERKVFISDRRKNKTIRANEAKEAKAKEEKEQKQSATGEEVEIVEDQEEVKFVEQRVVPAEHEVDLYSLPTPRDHTRLETRLAQMGRSQSFSFAPVQMEQAVEMTRSASGPLMFTGNGMSPIDHSQGGGPYYHHSDPVFGGLQHHGFATQSPDFGFGQQQQQTVAAAA